MFHAIGGRNVGPARKTSPYDRIRPANLRPKSTSPSWRVMPSADVPADAVAVETTCGRSSQASRRRDPDAARLAHRATVRIVRTTREETTWGRERPSDRADGRIVQTDNPSGDAIAPCGHRSRAARQATSPPRIDSTGTLRRPRSNGRRNWLPPIDRFPPDTTRSPQPTRPLNSGAARSE